MSKETAAAVPFQMAMIHVKRTGRGRWRVLMTIQPEEDAPGEAFTITTSPRSTQARAFTEALAGLQALAAEQGG